MSLIGAILLAAGASLRFGPANKLLAPLDDRPLVAHAAAAIRAAQLPMLVVLGCEAEAVGTALTAARPVPRPGREGLGVGRTAPHNPPVFVHAALWADGMGASLAAGARAAPPHWTGALICLGDMPHVTPADLRAIAAALTHPHAVAVPVHAGAQGNPVGFGRAWFPRLAALTGDRGARALLRDAVVTQIPAGPGVLRDVDTPVDLG